MQIGVSQLCHSVPMPRARSMVVLRIVLLTSDREFGKENLPTLFSCSACESQAVLEKCKDFGAESSSVKR